ncbi:MAG: hypothetical protein Phog2KO_17010 [Phototrophicaceae bacterium]
MSEFDDLRGLLDDDEDEFDDFSFDDIANDDDFSYGQEIGAPEAVPDKPGPLNQLLGSMTAQQRLFIAMMLFGNVAILSVGILLATGRIG